jgi:peptidoglycan/LPS O-acetylase OafA/YrhL
MNLFVAPVIANAYVADHGIYLARRRFSALDGMRCIAILAVIWHHSVRPSQFMLLNRGFLGVDLFFVISGFLIVTLLLREQQAHGGINLRNFYIRRALRIFPPYYAILAILAIVYGFGKPDDSSSGTFFALLPIYLFYVSNWSLSQATTLGITWSLATEEQFYLIWPPIQKWLRGKNVCVAIILVCAPTDISGLPRLAIHFLTAMLIGALVIREDTAFHPLLSHAIPVFIGAISYGMYLYHLWALHIVRTILAKTGFSFPYDLFLTGLLLTIIVSWISYQFFERYFLLWKTGFSYANSKG